MTLQMMTQSVPGGGWTSVDMSESAPNGAVCDIRYNVSYDRPAELTFNVIAAAHTLPMNTQNAIIFYDDAVQSFNDPLFEGYVEEISPGNETNMVRILCMDVTRRMTNTIQVMSAGWVAGDFDELTPPEEGVGAVPRLIFNATIDQDDDKAFSRAQWQTVGQMLSTILDDQYNAMFWINGANADGFAYTGTQLLPLDYVPQEKQVFESESLRSCMDRLLTQHPGFRHVWVPGPNNRKFKFQNVTTAATTTLTINDPTQTYPVMGVDMNRTLEGTKTAIKFFGPETTLMQTVYTAGLSAFQRNDLSQASNSGGLTALNPVVLETYDPGDGTQQQAVAYTKFRVADATKRRSAFKLPVDYGAWYGSYNVVFTRNPTLEVSLDEGSTWMTVSGWWFDAAAGEVNVPNYFYFWRSDPPPGGGDQNYWTPTNYRFTHAYYIDPISVRWPTVDGTYMGTAYTVAGVKNIDRIYDEMLSVGFQYGVPITTAERVEAFRKLGDHILKRHRDIVYTGNVTLHGHDYSFQRLGRRVNFAGVDQDGNALTTGWENVNAVLTDVTYDFGDSYSTSLTFNSDQMEWLGSDPDIRQKLGIVDLEYYMRWRAWIVTHNWYVSGMGHRMPGDQSLIVDVDHFYYNPVTGDSEIGIGPGGF